MKAQYPFVCPCRSVDTGTFVTETVSATRARIEREVGKTTEWRSKALPRFERLTRQTEALITSACLAGPTSDG